MNATEALKLANKKRCVYLAYFTYCNREYLKAKRKDKYACLNSFRCKDRAEHLTTGKSSCKNFKSNNNFINRLLFKIFRWWW